FGHPLETARVRFGGIAAHDQNQVRVLDVNPMVGHRSTAKRRGKTCHRRAVSDTRLVVESEYPHATDDLVRHVAGFVAGGGGGEDAGGKPAIHRFALVVGGDEVLVAIVLQQAGNAVE